MYKSKYNFFMLMILFFIPLITFSLNSWMTIWMMMELNLIIFLTYLILNNINLITDLCMKYFLLNSFCSSVFLMMIFFNYLNNNLISNYMINLMMIIKLGMMPFHYWFIDMMKNLNWLSCFILSTWQKLIPLIIMMFNYTYKFILIIIMISGIFSLIYTFNEINLKKVMAYSSINNMCWILMSMFISLNLFFIYYFSYMLILFILFFLLSKFNINYFFDLKKFYTNSIFYLFSFLMFSIGGLPPFFGFLMKWFFIYKFMFQMNFLVMIFLIFYSLIFLYYYIRMIYVFLLNNFLLMKNNLVLNFYFNNFSVMIMLFSLILLLMLLIYLN